jgi:hypothetical protein
METVDRIKAAKRAAVPIVAVETADPAETIRAIAKAINASTSTSFLQWDCCMSLRGMNELGDQVVALLSEGEDPALIFRDPAGMLTAMHKAPERTVLFVHNAHRIMDQAEVSQAIWNLRDVWKSRKSMLILLGPGIKLPDELTQDLVVLSEELPDREAIRKIVDDVLVNAKESLTDLEISEESKVKACDTLTGLSAFACEQQLSMSLSKQGVDLDELWHRKRKQIEQTDGLSIEKPAVTLADLRGCSQIYQFGKSLFNGKSPPTSLWLIDEIEKSMAGAKGDMSGTSQDQLMVLLTIMQDWGITGWIEIGPPGACKTFFPQCLAGEFGVPFGKIDLGAMKGSLVGESERKIRSAMKIVRAVSDNRGMFVATCNSISSLPPELRRRFTLGTWFFPLPAKDELKAMWTLYSGKFKLTKDQRTPVEDDGWTGAEVKACCDIAWRTGLKLHEAAQYIVPVSKAANETINTLYSLADNRFLSANAPGLFRKPKSKTEGGRTLELQ